MQQGAEARQVELPNAVHSKKSVDARCRADINSKEGTILRSAAFILQVLTSQQRIKLLAHDTHSSTAIVQTNSLHNLASIHGKYTWSGKVDFNIQLVFVPSLRFKLDD